MAGQSGRLAGGNNGGTANRKRSCSDQKEERQVGRGLLECTGDKSLRITRGKRIFDWRADTEMRVCHPCSFAAAESSVVALKTQQLLSRASNKSPESSTYKWGAQS